MRTDAGAFLGITLGYAHEVYHILEDPISNERLFLHILIRLTCLMLCGALLLGDTYAFSIGWGYYTAPIRPPLAD